MLHLPRSARLAAWGNAWLHGEEDLGTVLLRVTGGDEPHRVVHGLGGLPVGDLGEALEALQAAGTRSLTLALPAPGDPLGLPGPGPFTSAALDAGEAVLAHGCAAGLVPIVDTFGPPGDQGHLVTWQWWSVAAASPPTLPSVAEADRALAEGLTGASGRLRDLDVVDWRPEAAELLADLRGGLSDAPLPAGFPDRAQVLAVRAARLARLVAIAGRDDGGTVTSHAAHARLAAILALEPLTRRALVAACSTMAEPSRVRRVHPRDRWA